MGSRKRRVTANITSLILEGMVKEIGEVKTSGEIGYSIVDSNGRRCECGKYGDVCKPLQVKMVNKYGGTSL